ncbi:tRNA-cytidine(32) 2-sulfurtransferase [Frankliniella fusca]|uniref:tRNA-cytidine(32) 2-sulfurtransferase n=1 Tax=Frankliniella fusca TaxID=407009 RepID=A0AAE1HE02_9NEOP|nr:tRNA-cytidine(32) 2-sulfurtransferase [Frankliniella fusca]
MDDHTLKFYGIVKREPDEIISGDPIKQMDPTSKDPFHLTTDLTEMCFSSTIEDMNWNDFKSEAHLNVDEKASIAVEQEDTQQLQSPGSKIARSKRRNPIHFRKLLKIAKDYVDLYSDEDSHPTPFPQVLGFPIIECPSCMIPWNCRGRSAFLDMLLHVVRRHPNNSSFLFSIICERYSLLIGRMKRTIDRRNKRRYCLRLRTREHRKNVSGD